ncbi:MAG: VanW family protein [Chloroflexi bacterium]|nr:VanW family protein [Chloroflexota bacterium]
MSSTTPIRFVRPDRERRESGAAWIQMSVALLVGASFFLFVLIFLSLGYRLMYSGRIFPGISIAGVDVSGLKTSDAAIKIEAALTFPTSGRIVLRDGGNVWVETPANLGMQLDPTASADAAFEFGRAGGLFQNINDQLNAGQVGVIIPPVIVFDQGVAYTYLQNLAPLVEKPVTEASLVITGLDVSSQPGQLGHKLDFDSSIVYIHAQMQSFRDGEIPLVILDQAPQVMDASVQADAARRLLAAPFAITLPDARSGDPGPWQIEPVDLAPMLRVGRLGSGPGSQYVVQFDRDRLHGYLETISKQVDRPEADARFIFDEQTGQIYPIQASRVGLRVDSRGSMDAIQKAVGAGEQSAILRVDATQPLVADTATSQQLNIVQLVGSQTTYFVGSSAARKNNIETAASKYNGLLVAPGATFSMGQYMGDVSLDNGFAEALIIFNGKTIKGVGGGVCQVSTTLFRTVFYAGFPIAERHAHAYRVLYYEQGPGGRSDPSLSGFDATVYFPLVDFKFTNDTPYWLLMETFFDSASSSLTWKLFSTFDGRSVQATFSGPTNNVPALPPTVTFNPDAAPGSVTHVDYAVDGADVTINRAVIRNNQTLLSDHFVTNYQPWADACEYGPDVKDPEKILKKKGWCQKP